MAGNGKGGKSGGDLSVHIHQFKLFVQGALREPLRSTEVASTLHPKSGMEARQRTAPSQADCTESTYRIYNYNIVCAALLSVELCLCMCAMVMNYQSLRAAAVSFA